MKLTEQEIEALELGIAEDKSRISYLEQRVKALEEALQEIEWGNNSKWQSDRAKAALEATC